MQIIRLLQTILILLNRKQITAGELAERYDVSVRTIYRDIDALSLAGIPVYSVKGRNGGIFLDKQFSVDQTLIKEEQNDIFLALNLLKSIGLLDTEKVIDKLGQTYAWSSWIEIDLEGSLGLDQNNFSLLKQAIFEKRELIFIYYTNNGQTRQITLIPHKMIYKNQIWYLIGYDRLQEKLLPYELSQIKHIQTTNTQMSLDGIIDHFEITFEVLSVTLRFSKRIAYKKYAEFAHYKIETNPDSSFEITIDFAEIDELYRFLLPLGKNVEIISPLWVKERILSHVQAFYENHL